MVCLVYCKFRITGFGLMDEVGLRNLDVKLRRVQGLRRRVRDLAIWAFSKFELFGAASRQGGLQCRSSERIIGGHLMMLQMPTGECASKQK